MLTDPAVAMKEVELAVLSAMAVHGNGPEGLAVVQAAFLALERLDREHDAVYFQIIWNVLRVPMRRALEAMAMEGQTKGKATLPPFLEQIFNEADARVAKGRAEEAARAVLTVLRARGIAVPDAARERILAETDLVRLELWIERAVLAASVDDALREPS